MRYKIQVRTFQNNILTFTVDGYEVLEGDMIEFRDKVKDVVKRFHASQVEIEVIPNG